MKDNILSICLGNDNGKLCGSKNDAILFLNYLNLLHVETRLNQHWYKPKLFINDNVVEDNIRKYIENFDKKIDIILLYYSGHGFKDGKINIKTKEKNMVISDYSLIKLINDSIKNEVILYIILDCCYAGGFKIIPYDKVKKINLFASSSSNQLSYEGTINEEVLQNKLKNSMNVKELIRVKNSIIIGVFTYNLVDLLNQKDYKNINDWYKLKDETNLWKSINFIADQNPIFIWE